MQIQGYFDLKIEALKDAFAELFNDPQQRGAALCVQVGGETVLDLWAGVTDKDGQQAWHSDTILNLFSCTKTFTAVAVLQLVAEGKLELDAPVARYWPEFAAAGKQAISVRQLLCHQAGLPALRELLPAEALYDWTVMTSALAALLADHEITTRDDLADLAVDELIEIAPSLSEEQAKTLIMNARAHWFE